MSDAIPADPLERGRPRTSRWDLGVYATVDGPSASASWWRESGRLHFLLEAVGMGVKDREGAIAIARLMAQGNGWPADFEVVWLARGTLPDGRVAWALYGRTAPRRPLKGQGP